MFLELFEPDICAWIFVLSKPVIHQDRRMIRSAGFNGSPDQHADDDDGQQEQAFDKGLRYHEPERGQVGEANTILC